MCVRVFFGVRYEETQSLLEENEYMNLSFLF